MIFSINRFTLFRCMLQMFALRRAASALRRVRDTPTPFRDAFTPGSCVRIDYPLHVRGPRYAGRSPPAAWCAKVESARVSHRRSTGSPAFPAQWFYGLLRALPGEPGFSSPSPRNAKHCHKLTPASGRQDLTASPSARPSRTPCEPIGVHRYLPRVRHNVASRPSSSGTGFRTVRQGDLPSAQTILSM